MSVQEDGSNVLFVYASDVFFGMTERCVCKCAEDVQASFGFSAYFVSVLLGCHSCLIGHSKSCGSVSVRYRCVVECDGGS